MRVERGHSGGRGRFGAARKRTLTRPATVARSVTTSKLSSTDAEGGAAAAPASSSSNGTKGPWTKEEDETLIELVRRPSGFRRARMRCQPQCEGSGVTKGALRGVQDTHAKVFLLVCVGGILLPGPSSVAAAPELQLPHQPHTCEL